MVELIVMNENFEILSIIDDFSSLVWAPTFFGVGEFQFECNIKYLNSIINGSYIFRNDDETGVIEYFNFIKDETGARNILVRGKFLKVLLDERAVHETMNFNNKNIEEIILGLISRHFIETKEFPRFEVKYSSNFTDKISTQITGKSVLERIINIEEEQKVGCKVKYDYLNDKIVCSVIKGRDLTQNQSENDWVVFSEERENIFDFEYSKVRTFKNFVYVAGAGEGNERIVATVDIRKTGEPLKELYVDARDILDTDKDGIKIPMPQYISMLEQRGREKLSEYVQIEELKANINEDNILKYKSDYFLGDIIEFVDLDLGITAALRITGVTEEYEEGKKDLNVTFGKERLDLKQIIRREVI